MTQAYPLQWPPSWPRARYRHRAKFNTKGRSGYAERLSIADARTRLGAELESLGARYVALSSNLELRLDGLPRSGLPEPKDTGVAVYFQLQGKAAVLACDKWDRTADNIAAIARHVEALRGIDRWGVGPAAQAFAGYQTLPLPEQWWHVLNVPMRATKLEIVAAYRAAAMHARPDHGGNDKMMARLNDARDRALSELEAENATL